MLNGYQRLMEPGTIIVMTIIIFKFKYYERAINKEIRRIN